MKRTILLLLLFTCGFLSAQDQDSILVRRLFDEALTSNVAYENLRWLCKNTKGRIAGTPEAASAVEFTRQVMLDMDLDSVYLQELKVKRWVRGKIESARIISSTLGSEDLSITGLGLSVGTSDIGIAGNVIEVQNFEELEQLGEERIKGKIVFFNRPMDPTLLNTFKAYSGAVNQRGRGAIEAAKYGALAAIIRSVTTAIDDHPHTGVMGYEEGIPKIPAVCVSTMGADLLSTWLEKDPDLDLHLISNCSNHPDVTSHNVIGEIRGSTYPDEIITVGGHLDAWDNSEGAHDDGAGCIQSIETLRLYKELGIRPKRTVRAVMFMDEEIAQRGGKKYAELAKINGEKHYVALESDRGGLLPRGFGIGASGERLEKMLALEKYFAPYGITEFRGGGGGVDIGPLREFGTVLISLVPDMQRYFDYHHSPNDTFKQVNIRELQLGSASIASLIYLIDKNDL
ncbi:MAG TPA: peptidase M28 family protein [Bacteroides sp.]|nr:peptidase M28 family protein [Bacteroides sp.]